MRDFDRMCSARGRRATQAIARAFDLDDDGVVKEPVQEGRGDDGITKTSPHSAKPRLEVRIMAPFS